MPAVIDVQEITTVQCAGGGGSGAEKGQTEEMERRLFSLQKRGGARAFGSTRSQDFENFFFPSSKRHETFSPYYYYYQQPKRAGGRSFYSYWSPPNVGDARYAEDSPFYRKRSSSFRDIDDYGY